MVIFYYRNMMPNPVQRRHIKVQGIVQGVGFRPFVYRLAKHHHLAGFVLNDSAGVTIEVEGPGAALDLFEQELRTQPPPLAQIKIVETSLGPVLGETDFVIRHSQADSERRTLIAPDIATCPNCQAELFEPADRRYLYPFINCTDCGPRFTIITDIPYDRDKTTMRPFKMCSACRAEYEEPLNRRFHAQPNACPVCGPHIYLLDASDLNTTEVMAVAAQSVAAGYILAVKGLGGYHLACDALNVEAVSRLRQRKQRAAKPFAVMVPDVETARQLCRLNEAEAALLESPRRPIVLLARQTDDPIAPAVAPGQTTLGVMLPYTPLHHLLLAAFARLVGLTRPAVLVMTSGNRSDEPIAYRDEEAQTRLNDIADGFLLHDREIYIRCDDSVARVISGPELTASPAQVQMLRRARGYVPEPVTLAEPFPLPLLACGGHLKNTFCLGQDRQAFVSHHIGDLENLETLSSFRAGIDHFKRLFDIQPEAVAYDLHPEYLATKYALTLALPHRIGVQHHHAHIAGVLAEHHLSGPIIGLAADGTGYGLDGAIWGGEVFIADLVTFERVAHLAYMPLPGGDRAIIQPWRMAAVYLAQAYGDDFLALDIPFVKQQQPALSSHWRVLAQMIARKLNSPPTSSLGRLFDAVSALVGLCPEVIYEGQAAIELEAQAIDTDRSYPFTITENLAKIMILDVIPMIRAIVLDLQQGVPASAIAGRFHTTLVELLAAVCERVRARRNLNSVALSGGVFQNQQLLTGLLARLEGLGFQVYINRQVPPNDGGLSLGQAAVAAAHLRSRLQGESNL
jgi:hydrogenase maturation protein HypF